MNKSNKSSGTRTTLEKSLKICFRTKRTFNFFKWKATFILLLTRSPPGQYSCYNEYILHCTVYIFITPDEMCDNEILCYCLRVLYIRTDTLHFNTVLGLFRCMYISTVQYCILNGFTVRTTHSIEWKTVRLDIDIFTEERWAVYFWTSLQIVLHSVHCTFTVE